MNLRESGVDGPGIEPRWFATRSEGFPDISITRPETSSQVVSACLQEKRQISKWLPKKDKNGYPGEMRQRGAVCGSFGPSKLQSHSFPSLPTHNPCASGTIMCCCAVGTVPAFAVDLKLYLEREPLVILCQHLHKSATRRHPSP